MLQDQPSNHDSGSSLKSLNSGPLSSQASITHTEACEETKEQKALPEESKESNEPQQNDIQTKIGKIKRIKRANCINKK